jgi:nudix-type nucleoside diphosphatase (YffH/AdpP family)
VHELKHDGYRLIVRWEGKAVRLAASASPTFGPRMDCDGAAHVCSVGGVRGDRMVCDTLANRACCLQTTASSRLIESPPQELTVPPQILSTLSLYDGWTTLRLVQLRLESGDVIEREVEDHGNAVAVLPFDPVRRTALLVRGLRAPALLSAGRTDLLECPAGLIEEADPAQAARREANEEVGLRLRELEHVGRVWTSPGISTEMMDLYLAPYSAADRVHAGVRRARIAPSCGRARLAVIAIDNRSSR